ncbi:MAG: carboxy-S-adenosyl-L-methionine synthase CmoA [Pseudomonadota bacterium]
MAQDQVFSRPRSDLVDFRFDAEVVGVFPDMIRRSVPAYETVLPLAALILARHLAAGAKVYDLGSSLGASSLALLKQSADPQLRVTGIDASPDMVQTARAQISDPRVSFHCAGVQTFDYEPCDGILLNYLLQFIPLDERGGLLEQLFAALKPGGCLVLTEKVELDNDEDNAWAAAVHLDFKRANGYSELEIAQKRAALERVMPIETEQTHLERLRGIGFTPVRQWFRCLNWAAFVAWKP